MTTTAADAIKREFAKFIAARQAQAALTVNFNRDAPTIAWAEDKLRFYWRRLKRRLLGPRWHDKPGLLMEMIAVPEHLCSNLHYHAAIVVPNEDHIVRLGAIAQPQLKHIVPAASVDVQLLLTSVDRAQWADYMTKSLYDPSVRDGYVILS